MERDVVILLARFDRWRATGWLRVARHWLDEGEYELAGRWAQRAVAVARRRAGLATLAADALTVLAGAAQALGEYARAEAAGRDAVVLLGCGAGSRDRLVAAMVQLADVHRLRGHYEAAEQLLHQATATAADVDDPLTLAAVHNGLGIVCKDVGRFDDAESHYQRALTAAQAQSGRNDLLVAALWHNLAGLAHARGRYREAEPAARRAVELRERLRGPDHPEVARDLTVLAATLAGQGRLDESEALYRRALDIFQRRLGAQHYEVAVVLNSLGGLAQDRHDPVEAEKLQRRALSIKERVLGPDHAEVAAVLNNLAVSLHRQGRTDEAAQLYRRALAVFDKTVSDTHPAAIICRANYKKLRAAAEGVPLGDGSAAGASTGAAVGIGDEPARPTLARTAPRSGK